ncbi:unnamed protein product [Pieris macdunnoughi]|uniref:Uncharacterized protein n=1 Tax=Pieris macdunnoughi TaxID=345717 RepID=A0A821TPA0_9NEOP|nr:unnamed protein product [Pieris macdunnoughi]
METAKLCRASTIHTHNLTRHPIHKHESELPSSLNKRTQTQPRTDNVYPLSVRRSRGTAISTMHYRVRA